MQCREEHGFGGGLWVGGEAMAEMPDTALRLTCDAIITDSIGV